MTVTNQQYEEGLEAIQSAYFGIIKGLAPLIVKHQDLLREQVPEQDRAQTESIIAQAVEFTQPN